MTDSSSSNSKWKEYVSEDPVAYGIDMDTWNTQQKRTWKAQERYLAYYSQHRTKGTSAVHAGVGRTTAHRWDVENVLGFAKRLEHADQHFLNQLETHALNVALQTKAGQSPILLLAMLNANLPDKYRPNVVVSDGTGKETLTELRSLSQELKEAKERRAAQVPPRADGDGGDKEVLALTEARAVVDRFVKGDTVAGD